MYHFIYKTSVPSGKYYIGRHSTNNLDDGYIGSGKWPRSLKNLDEVSVEILEFCDNGQDLISLEQDYLDIHYGTTNCMNFNNRSSGFGVGDANWSRSEEARKFKSDNHYAKANTSYSEWFSENNPSKMPEVKEKRRKKAYEQLKEGTHNFQNPEVVERKNKTTSERMKGDGNIAKREDVRALLSQKAKKEVSDGLCNFLKPEVREKALNTVKNRTPQRRKEIGDKLSKACRGIPKKKVACPACGKVGGAGAMHRYHFDNCKSLNPVPKKPISKCFPNIDKNILKHMYIDLRWSAKQCGEFLYTTPGYIHRLVGKYNLQRKSLK